MQRSETAHRADAHRVTRAASVVADQRRFVQPLAHDHLLGGYFQRLRHQHGERGFVALPLRMRHRVHDDAPIALHLYRHLILRLRAAGGGFDHGGYAASAQLAGLGRDRLARGKARPIGGCQCLVHQAREIGVFVDRARRRFIGKRLGGNIVAPPQIHRINAGLERGLLHQPLHHEGDIGPPRPAIIADGRGIGQRHTKAPIQRGDAIRAGETHHRITDRRHRCWRRHIGADFGDPIQPYGNKFSISVQRQLALHHAATAVVIREEGFCTC